MSGAETPARRGLDLTQKGIASLSSGRPADAANFLQESLGAYRADPESYYYLARAGLAGGDRELAARALALARERFPGFCEANGSWGLFPPLSAEDTGNGGDHIDHDALLAQCHAELADGLVFLDAARPAGAIAPLLRALEINPWRPQAYYYLASAFASSGEMEKATAVFTKATEDLAYVFQRFSGFGDYQGLGLDAKTTIAYYHALGGIFPDIKPYLGGLTPGDGGVIRLSESRSDALRTLYETRTEDWASGTPPRPSRADVFDPTARQAKVLLVVPKFIKSNADWVEYDVAVHLGGTGRAHLPDFAVHYADAIHSEQAQLIGGRSEAVLTDGIEALERDI